MSRSSLWWDVERARWDAEREKTTPPEPNPVPKRGGYQPTDSMPLGSKPPKNLVRPKTKGDNPLPEPNRERYPLEDFMAQVAKRLEKGAVEYGAESYLFDNVTRQIKEELEDIAGWASLGWAKLNRVEELWRELVELVDSEGVE